MNDSLAFQVELFADLMVRLDHPFAARDAVFAWSGLDDASYRRLVDGWRTRFDRDETGQLAARFADAYALARVKLRDAAGREARGEAQGADPRFLSAEAQSFRDEAAKVALSAALGDAAPPPNPAPLAGAPAPILPSIIVAPPRETEAEKRARFGGTMDISNAIPRDSMPFVPAEAAVSRPSEPLPAPPRSSVPTGTADISAAIPRDLLPFPTSPAPPAPPPPAQAPARPFVGTADISAFVPREAMPFSGAPAAIDRPAAPPEPQPISSTGVRRPPPQLGGTADISAFIPRAATPFAAGHDGGRPPIPPGPAGAPPVPAPPAMPEAAQAAPRRRLIRFDPQTGQPLPAPIWVDLPPEPEPQKR